MISELLSFENGHATTPINQSLVMGVGETSGFDPIITHNGVEVFECLCGDDIW